MPAQQDQRTARSRGRALPRAAAADGDVLGIRVRSPHCSFREWLPGPWGQAPAWLWGPAPWQGPGWSYEIQGTCHNCSSQLVPVRETSGAHCRLHRDGGGLLGRGAGTSVLSFCA